MGGGRPGGDHVSGDDLRNLRVVPGRARALLPEADQLRLHPAGRAERNTRSFRRRRWCECRRSSRRRLRLRSAARAGRPMARCAKPGWRRANRWPSSAMAGWDTWRCRSRGIRDCGSRWRIHRKRSWRWRAPPGPEGDDAQCGCGDCVYGVAGRDPAGLPGAAAQRHADSGGPGELTTYELPLVDTVLKGITIRGSYLGTREDLAAVFGLAREGVVRPTCTRTGWRRLRRCWIRWRGARSRGGR